MTTQYTVSEGREFSPLKCDTGSFGVRSQSIFFVVVVVVAVRDSSKVCGQPGLVSAAVSAPLFIEWSATSPFPRPETLLVSLASNRLSSVMVNRKLVSTWQKDCRSVREERVHQTAGIKQRG